MDFAAINALLSQCSAEIEAIQNILANYREIFHTEEKSQKMDAEIADYLNTLHSLESFAQECNNLLNEIKGNNHSMAVDISYLLCKQQIYKIGYLVNEVIADLVMLRSHHLLLVKTRNLTDELVSLITAITHVNQTLTSDEMKMHREIENKFVSLTQNLDEVKNFLQMANKHKTFAKSGATSATSKMEVKRSAIVEHVDKIDAIKSENTAEKTQLPENVPIPPIRSSKSFSCEGVDWTSFREMMCSAYNTSELEILCADLKVPFENVKREELTTTVLQITEYFKRREDCERLVLHVMEERANVVTKLGGSASILVK